MRAVVIRELNNRDAVTIEDLPSPVPAQDEVLIDAYACGINFTDYLSLDGRYQNNPAPPFTPGKDAAGVVIAAGPDVTRLKVGDRVVAHVTYGGLAEQCTCVEARCFVLPDDVSFVDAAGLGLVFMTAYFACFIRGALKAGERVLVNGASGGVGLAMVGLAKGLDAGQVLAGLTTPSKAKSVLEAGADGLVDLSGDDLRTSVRKQVDESTGGHGVDLVVDLLGGDFFDASLRCVSRYGRIVVTGFASGIIPTLRTNYLLLKNISVVGMTLQTFLDEHASELERAHDKIFEMLAEGRIGPNVTSICEFGDFMTAIERIERRDVGGKSVIRIR